MTPRSAAVTAASSSSGRSITGIANPRTVPYRNPDLWIRGREIHPFRWTNIDTLYPRPYTPLAAIVAVDSVRIAAGVVTAGEGGRTTGERDTCKDRAQKNPTANHGCLSFLPVRRARRAKRQRPGDRLERGLVAMRITVSSASYWKRPGAEGGCPGPPSPRLSFVSLRHERHRRRRWYALAALAATRAAWRQLQRTRPQRSRQQVRQRSRPQRSRQQRRHWASWRSALRATNTL